MSTIKIHDKFFEPYLSAEAIQNKIKDLAKTIEEDYLGKEICFVTVLNGALFFASDLILHINSPCTLETIKCSSYRGTESTGEIKFDLPFNAAIKNKHVVFLEDIVDTGNTLQFLLEEIKSYEPASVKICSLLFKPEALQHKLHIDYIGFEIPTVFVLGYGLDYDGLGRNYRDIYKLLA